MISFVSEAWEFASYVLEIFSDMWSEWPGRLVLGFQLGLVLSLGVLYLAI
jgi:hypothetical protein